MDMVAGLEHLGRGTARRVDTMLVVVEPRMKSVDTIRRILRLAAEIEVQEVLAVGNKINGENERWFIEDRMGELDIPVAAHIPFDTAVADADMLGVAPLDHDENSSAVKALIELKEYLKRRYDF